MLAFDIAFRELAEKESLALDTLHVDGRTRNYLFRELYCNEPRCDCRRVMLHVYDAARPRVPAASINYSFEPPTAPSDDEPQMFLDPINPQSDAAPALFDLFQEVLAEDPGYRDRLIRHYEMWKRVVDDPEHPDHLKIRSSEHDNPAFRPAFPIRRESPKIGPNEPCPCGSSKKYKRCCRK